MKRWGKVEKMGKSGEKCGKVTKSGEKWGKVVKSGEKWGRWENVLFLNFGQNGRRRHFGCPKITFDHSSCHFRSIRNFFFFEIFGQNGRRRPFWIGRQCQLSNSSEIFG